ncbi:MAG: putative lipid II flippase FtsW [Nostocoides sp.]
MTNLPWTSGTRGASGLTRRFSTAAARLESPTTNYYLLLVLVGALVAIGLIMVLSASTVVSLHEDGSAYSIFLSQALFVLIGTVALVVATRLPVLAWKRLAIPALVLALFLQVLVFTGLGQEVLGNKNWLRLGPITVQPSELIKVGLVLSGGLVLARKRTLLDRPTHVLIPYVIPIAALSIGLVLLGHDLGTSIVLMSIVAGALFVAGVPTRYFAIALAAVAAVATVFVLNSSNRLSRFAVWLGNDTNPYGAYRQPLHGRYALADGGWFGLGLGASREKWSWLSAPHNDFIFAVIGEELGLPGTWVVIGLFLLIGWACYRLTINTSDAFVRIVTAGIMSWLLVQAMVNIGSVIGLLPVIGLPLPLVSSGGSSLVTTMLAFGILLSFARAEPGCREALDARPSVVRRTLAIIPRRAQREAR